jgi:tetratricopeptide (TPR) repeat protein
MERERNIKDATTIVLLSFGLLISTTLLVVTLFASVAEAKPAGVLLQEGVYAEEIEGDLDAAIRIYEQAISEARTVERVAAQATYRIGMCYLKKGEEEQAAVYFQDVVSKFPQQKPLVAKAQDHLAKLKPVFTAGSAGFGPVIERVIYEPEPGSPRESWIDFESGKLFKAPESLDEDQARAFEWFRTTGIDAQADTSGSVRTQGLVAFPPFHPAAIASPGGWNASADTVIAMTGSLTASGKTKMFAKDPLPTTYFFKTRQGNIGVLDVLGFTEGEPRGVRFRYKMLQEVAKAKSYRPVVVASVPATYSNDVSPELSEISVTFDRAMADGSWAWVQWNYRYPETVGKPYYDAAKTTCTLPVKLEPGKAYFVRINAAPYTSFRSANGVSAQPYVLVFATKDKDGNPTPIPGDMLGTAKAINSVKPKGPYTQELFADIRPDGTFNFKSTIQRQNESGEAINTTSFVNSDFVKVTAMHDNKGRPIEFTTVREGSTWRYHATLNEPVRPGEMMVYSNEGTMTGLVKPVAGEKDTFQCHMRHHPSTGRPTLRIETHLLPEGAELISTTPPDMQRRTMDGRTELHVEELIPAGGSITTAFKYRLAGAQLAKAKPLELIPAPFFDGEVMRLKLSTPVGAEIGQVIYATEAIERDGQYPWRIQSYMHIGATNMQQYTEVHADRMTLAPISSRTKNWLGDFQATYSPGAVQLVSNIKGAKSTKDFAVKGPVYDNEQAMYVIRSMPLKDGYSASFDIFPVQSGVVSECRIRVTGTEKVRLRPGLIECFAIELSVYAQGIKALTHHLWISTEEDRRLVKYDSGAAIMELMGTERRNKERPQQVVDALNGYSFELPHGWHYASSQGPHKASTQLLAPELKAWAVLVADERPSQIQSAREVAESEVERVKGVFKDYTVRADSWTENQWFVFRIELDQFGPNRPEFDSIINSFRQVRSFGVEQKRDGESLAANGWRLWKQRKLVEAEKAFKEAVEKDPTNANAWNGLGWSQSNQGKPLNAKVSFEKCLEIEPEHPAALNGLGWIAKGQGKTDEAIGHWEKAVAAAPTATAALGGLATTYMELKQYDKAIQYYKMWLKAEPDNTDAKAGLAKAVASHQSR